MTAAVTMFLPPDVQMINEPAVAPMIVANGMALEFQDGAVWMHVLTRHSLSDGTDEWRREAILCWTAGDYARARAWLDSLRPYPKDPKVIRIAEVH